MNKLTQTEVIARFRKVHGDRYIYDHVDYVGALKKVKIICRQHGQWMQKSNNHLRGQGCSRCRTIATSRLNSRRSRKERNKLLLSNSIASCDWKKKTKSMTSDALISGEITRRHQCQICDRDSDEVCIEAHHIHYDRPDSWHCLEWLCRDCHVTYGHGGHFHNPPLSVVPDHQRVYNLPYGDQAQQTAPGLCTG